MNTVQLIGRLTKDIELRYAKENMAVARFTLAVNRFKRDAGADFISCIAFGKTAELMDKYVGKGSQIGIVGRIQTGSFEKDGKKVYTTDVIADQVEFLGKKESNEESQVVSQIPEGFAQLTDDDIPF